MITERIYITANELVELSGLSLAAWGIDASTRVCVGPDFINAATADGFDIPNLCGGGLPLQRRVWDAARRRWPQPECDGMTA